MDAITIRTAIEFVLVGATEGGSVSGNSALVATSDTAMTALIVFGLIALLFLSIIGFAAYKQRSSVQEGRAGQSCTAGCSSTAGQSKTAGRSMPIAHSPLCAKARKIALAVFATLLLCGAVFALIGLPSRAFASGSIYSSNTIKVLVDEESETVAVEGARMANDTGCSLVFRESYAEIAPEAQEASALCDAMLSITGTHGTACDTLYDGKPDGRTYTGTPCAPVENGNSVYLTVAFDDLPFDTAKDLAGKGPAINVYCVFEQECIVDFNCQGTGADPESQKLAIGSKVQQPDAPTVDGFVLC